jgi:hypothetical protein
MKIIDGLKLKGKKIEIPDCSRDDLPEFFKEMDYTVGVEVGIYKGEFTEKLCKEDFKIYAVDPWMSYGEYGLKHKGFQERQNTLYKQTRKKLKTYKNCVILRKTSMGAVENFKDESLDFVYIDGNHEFKYVSEDIWEWSKKIRKGGVISGHDYVTEEIGLNDLDSLHVRYVVDAYTLAWGIKNWYILGKQEIVKGEKRDKYRSWLWIKE